MGEKWSGTIWNQRNGDKWFKRSHLENTWWTKGLNLALKTLQVHLVKLQLPEGDTLLRTLQVPKPVLHSIIFIFVIRKDFSNCLITFLLQLSVKNGN